jgi:mono/diheme cytochrome c family protein
VAAFYRFRFYLTLANSNAADIFPLMGRRFCLAAVVHLFLNVALYGQATKSVWDGSYTAAQAERGHKAYEANCGGCHQEDLRGKGEVPALKDDAFMERWHDYKVRPLFDLIKTEMPPLRFRTPDTKPLADDTYVDIIAYIFTANGFPAGSSELTLDKLDQVQILAKGGVQPPPQFALVLSVGCMTYKPVSWTLTSATAPVRATRPDVATREEIEDAKTKVLSLYQYRLADFGYLGRDFDPEALEDHRILVKGYIIRQKDFERISVTSVSDIAPHCE